MNSYLDIVVFSRDLQPVLVVKCRRGSGADEKSATDYRLNLLTHDFVPKSVSFLLAYPTTFFLWKQESSIDAKPDFTAPALPLLRGYVGKLADDACGWDSSSLELLLSYWLSELAADIRTPNHNSEAERMLSDSGLLEKIRFGKIRTQVPR